MLSRYSYIQKSKKYKTTFNIKNLEKTTLKITSTNTGNTIFFISYIKYSKNDIKILNSIRLLVKINSYVLLFFW